MNHATTVNQGAGVCRLSISLLFTVWLQMACTSGNQQETAVEPMKFSVPGGDALLRVVNIDTVRAQIEWRLSDGSGTSESRNMTRSGGSEVWESPPIMFTIGTSYDVSVVWSATGVDGVNVDYAQQDYSYTSTSESGQIDLSDQSYNFDRFDDDNDNANNYEELLAETPPTDADTCLSQGGSDPGSTNDRWNDNCTILYDTISATVDVEKSPFYKSTYVQGIQRILFCQGYAPAGQNIDLFADGLYGQFSFEAVKDFQEAEGLLVDGHIGPATWGALQELVDNNETLVSVHSDDKYTAYGILPSVTSTLLMIEDCSQVTHFFHRSSDSSEIDGWEMARTPGENSKGPFSVAEP